MVLSDTDIIRLIETPHAAADILKASELQADAELHFTGENYDSLITQLIGYEDANDYKNKRELGEPVTMPIAKTLFTELTRFNSTGRMLQYIDFSSSDADKKKYTDTLNKIYNDTSLKAFVDKWLLPALFYRFNDFIIVTKPKIEGQTAIIKGIERPITEAPEKYIITVGIDKVKDYRKTGDKVEYLIYEYNKEHYRVIDDERDLLVKHTNEKLTILQDSVIKHKKIPVRQVGILLKKINNNNLCKSIIDEVIPLMRRYIKFDAINVISETKHSFPLTWAYGQPCTNPKCDEGYEFLGAEKKICQTCSGTKYLSAIKPGNVMLIPHAIIDTQRPMASTPAGIIEGSVSTVKNQAERLKEREESIYQYALGSQPYEKIVRTATEVEHNIKPLEDRNATVSSGVETIIKWIIDVVCSDSLNYKGATITFPKRLSIKSDEGISKELQQAKLNGATQSYIKSLVEEQIYIRYSNDDIERDRQLILLELEPLIGWSVAEVINNPYVTEDDKRLKIYMNDAVDIVEREEKALINNIVAVKGIDKTKELLISKIKTNEQTNEKE